MAKSRGCMIGQSIVGVILLATGINCFTNNRLPVGDIPTPTLPTPNGFDALVQVGTLVKANEKQIAPLSDAKAHPTQAQLDALDAPNSLAISQLKLANKMEYLQPPSRSTTRRTRYS